MNFYDLRWNHEQTIKFIGLIHSHPLLWNKNLPEHANRKRRTSALEKIASKMGATMAGVRYKYNLMRSQCTRERRLIKKGERTSPRFRYYKEMQFLFEDENDEDPLSVGDCEEDDDEVFTDSEFQDDNTYEHLEESENEDKDGTSQWSELTQTEEHLSDDSLNGLDKSPKPEQNARNVEVTKEIDIAYCEKDAPPDSTIHDVDAESADQVKDEYTIFGENVAKELRMLDECKSLQLSLKCKIIQAMLEANEAMHRLIWIK